MVGTSALAGIIGNIHQQLPQQTLINAARWVLWIPMFHKSSTIQRHIGRLPYLLAQGECYSGAEMQLLFYFVFFLQESWRCIVSTKCWRRLGLLQWTWLRVEGKECEGSACLTCRNFFSCIQVTCELPPRPNPTPPPTYTSPTPPPDPWSTFGGLTNVEVFIGMFVICALAMVCLCSCKRRAEDDTESLFQVDGGGDNVAYEPPPPPSYTPPRQPKSDGPPSYDEAVNMA